MFEKLTRSRYMTENVTCQFFKHCLFPLFSG